MVSQSPNLYETPAKAPPVNVSSKLAPDSPDDLREGIRKADHLSSIPIRIGLLIEKELMLSHGLKAEMPSPIPSEKE